MTKNEVIFRFCALSSKVGGWVFKHEHPHDCFCTPGVVSESNFRFEEPIIKFIEDAVEEKLKQLPDPSETHPVKKPSSVTLALQRLMEANERAFKDCEELARLIEEEIKQ